LATAPRAPRTSRCGGLHGYSEHGQVNETGKKVWRTQEGRWGQPVREALGVSYALDGRRDGRARKQAGPADELSVAARGRGQR
jgi:hypothetical protein